MWLYSSSVVLVWDLFLPFTLLWPYSSKVHLVLATALCYFLRLCRVNFHNFCLLGPSLVRHLDLSLMSQDKINPIPPGLGLHLERICLFVVLVWAYVILYIYRVFLTFPTLFCRLCTTGLIFGTMCLRVKLSGSNTALGLLDAVSQKQYRTS